MHSFSKPAAARGHVIVGCQSLSQRRLPPSLQHAGHSAPASTSAAATASAYCPGHPSRRGCIRGIFAAATAHAAGLGAADDQPPPPLTERAVAHKTRAALVIACLAMSMAAVHRVAFSVLALPIQAEFAFSLPQMGMLQAALLVGYVLGQIPCGILADRLGGARLAVAGLFLWSLVCVQFSRVPGSSNPFVALLAVRAALGLAQSCIMPAVGALAARWFPASRRSRYTSTVYSSYSVGTVAGLALTPLVAEHLGWASTFSTIGFAGMAAAAVAGFFLPTDTHTAVTRQQQRQQQQRAAQLAQAAPDNGAGACTEARSGGSSRWLGREALVHLALLAFTHSVISWSFFIMQSWIPALLSSLRLMQLTTVGVLSALPWLATATVAVLAGGLADSLQAQQGWSALRVRHTMQVVASGGTALSLLPLALPSVHPSPAVAVAALIAAVAFQGCSYAGFHSYVQDVAPKEAGLVLGITNTCGTLVGIGGNLLTGWLAASRWGYAGVFAVTIILQAASLSAWVAGAHGRRLELSSKD